MSSTRQTLLPSHWNLTSSCYEKLLSWHLTTNTRSLVTPKKKPWILLIRDFIVLFRSDIQNGHIYISYSFQLTWSEVMCDSLGIRGSCVVPFQNCVRHPCNVYSGFFSEIFLSADLYWWCKLGIFDKRSNLNHFLWNCRTKLNQIWQGWSFRQFIQIRHIMRRKKSNQNLLLRNLRWNDLWLAHFPNYVWHPLGPMSTGSWEPLDKNYL